MSLYHYDELIYNYLLSERVAGWEKEFDMIKNMRDSICENICSDSMIHSIETLKWSQDRCLINKDIRCSVQPPYKGDIILEGYLTNDPHNCSDKILLISTTEYPDNTWILYNLAVENSALSVIFYDYYPDRYRRIVINGDWHYSFHKSMRNPVPAVHIRLNDYPTLRRYLGKRISIDLRSSLSLSKGYILETIIEGKDPKKEIILSAHHDSWYSGFRDDGVGLLTILFLAKNLEKMNISNLPTIRLISFTAEEFGDPRNPGWYWAYGSRYYLEKIYNIDNTGSKTMISVVIDTAFKEPIHISYSYPDLGYFVAEKLDLENKLDGYGHPYMDSISFIQKGIPTITLHNFNEIIPVYHTNLDTLYSGWIGFLEKFSISLIKLFAELRDEKALRPRMIINELKEYLPVPRYERLYRKISYLNSSKDYMYLHSCLTRSLLKPIVLNSYRKLYTEIHLYLLLMIPKIKNVEKVIVAGEEKILDVRNRGGEDSFTSYLENRLDEFEECLGNR